MMRFLDAVTNADDWERLAPTDPHFSPAYYRAFGGGQLFVMEEHGFKMVQPFRHQEKGWIGNAYNYGGPVGDYELTYKFQTEFDLWKDEKKLNERCIVCPFVKGQYLSRTLTARDVVLVDLTAIKIRQTTRHMIAKAAKAEARTVIVDDSQNIEMFESMYTMLMLKKDAKDHWYYTPGTFAKVLTELGPKRSALFVTTLNGTVESACICIFDEKVCYYHWAATLGHRRDLGANHFQVWSVINWAQERGLSYVHLGGGLSPNDGLFKFKAGFSPITRKVFSYETKARES